MMIVFKALKKIRYGAIAEKSVNGGHFKSEVKLTFSLKRLNLAKKCQQMSKAAAFSYKEILFQRNV